MIEQIVVRHIRYVIVEAAVDVTGTQLGAASPLFRLRAPSSHDQ